MSRFPGKNWLPRRLAPKPDHNACSSRCTRQDRRSVGRDHLRGDASLPFACAAGHAGRVARSRPDAGRDRPGVPHRRVSLVAHSGKAWVFAAPAPRFRDSVTGADILHTHGVWYMPGVYAGSVARQAGCPVVYSVHGMLAPQALQRSRWAKTVLGRLGQRAALESAACIHATADSELMDIRRFGLQQPVAIVPYGVDIPVRIDPLGSRRRTALFLGRVDPIKRVDVLIRAWREVEGAFPSWDLVVCGPDSVGHLSEMEGLAAELGLARVTFVGPKYGDQKARLVDSSELLVLPSHTENFGFVVAEALSAGVPAIVTRGAPWQELESRGCGWWRIDISVESLAHALRAALAMAPSELRAMGARGREWMIRDLSWGRVAEMMELTYSWALGLADRPDWVHLA